jgi:hypothetical protein
MADAVEYSRGTAERGTGSNATRPRTGNPGTFIRIETIDGVSYARYRAQENTWVSSSLKERGYDSQYGKGTAYGAYAGVVRAQDGTALRDPDHIQPGQEYLIPVHNSSEAGRISREQAQTSTRATPGYLPRSSRPERPAAPNSVILPEASTRQQVVGNLGTVTKWAGLLQSPLHRLGRARPTLAPRATDAGTKLLDRGTDAGTKLLDRQPAKKEPAVPQKEAAAGKQPSKNATPPAQPVRKIYPGVAGGGRRIWAYRSDTGKWGPESADGWDRPFEANSLQELVDGLKKRKLEGQVEKLAIVAHGDAPGVVQLKPQLTPESLSSVKAQLSQLSTFLKPNGKLLFESCIAGDGEPGTKLLTDISKLMPNVYVIGFEIPGGRSPWPEAPGRLYEKTEGMATGKQPENPVWLNEYSKFSKWALNGEIIRYDLGDQSLRPQKHCANLTCPGHANAADKCDLWP